MHDDLPLRRTTHSRIHPTLALPERNAISVSRIGATLDDWPTLTVAVYVSEIERKLAAIFAADVEGYNRLMGLDEVATLRTLTAYGVIIRLIAFHLGRNLQSGWPRNLGRVTQHGGCAMPSPDLTKRIPLDIINLPHARWLPQR